MWRIIHLNHLSSLPQYNSVHKQEPRLSLRLETNIPRITARRCYFRSMLDIVELFADPPRMGCFLYWWLVLHISPYEYRSQLRLCFGWWIAVAHLYMFRSQFEPLGSALGWLHYWLMGYSIPDLRHRLPHSRQVQPRWTSTSHLRLCIMYLW